MTGQARAWAWVAHLRVGGTTPWAEFHDEAESQGPWLPGAIQLEVARRLNQVQPDRALVDRILDSSAPGRGQPDLELAGAASGRRFGPPPVEPATLPTSELLRMAVGVLAELVVEQDTGTASPDRGHPASPPGKLLAPGGAAGIFRTPSQQFSRARQRRSAGAPWRRAFHLVGDPQLADETRAALRAAGKSSGRRSPVVLVLADDLAGMLSDLWAWRVRHTVHAGWPWWVAHWARRDQLPPRLDLAQVTRTWADRVGAANVHVIVGADPGPEVAGLLGVRRGLPPSRARMSPDAVETVRQTNAVLRVITGQERHQELLDRVLVPALDDHRGPRRAVPEEHLAWVRRRAENLRRQVLSGEYPVHGDPDLVLPGDRSPTAAPTDEGTLDVALRALLGVKEASR